MRDQDRSTREPAAPIEPAQYEPSRMDEKDGPESRGRRKFLKTAALTGAPVILTVASRPAWGTPHFCTPSGWCSGASVPDDRWAECAAGGDGPSYWSGSDTWTLNGVEYDLNKIYFGPGHDPHLFDEGPDVKIKNLWGRYTAFHEAAVAAYLNALRDPRHQPTVSALQCIVRDILGTNATYITTGCSWNIDEATIYLQSTFM